MSKIRSWDRMADDEQRYTAVEVFNGYPNRVRVVEWPEGAPPPEDVPQAGALVTLKHATSGDDGRVFEVVNGIPEKVWHTWRLRLRPVSDPFNTDYFVLLNIIRPYVEPERTYTEAEIRAVFTSRGDYPNAFIRDLNKEA